MAVNRDDRLIDVGDMAIDPIDQGTEFRRRGVADGIRDVDRGGPGSNRRLDHLIHELRIGAAGVLAGELDVFHEGAGVGHQVAGDAQHLSATLAELVLEVDVARGNKGVDAAIGGRRHRIGAGLDVALGRPGQATDHRSIGRTHTGGDALHRIEVTRTRERKTRLDDVDAKPGQLLGDRQLLLQVEAGPRGLLPITQGGVEDQYPAGIAGHGGYKSEWL